jgi:hypothetical protein
MRVLTGAAVALALVGSAAGAHAQVIVEPAPVYVSPAPYYAYSRAPVVVAAPPVVVAPAYSGSVVVNARTGRSCTIEPDGYRWCWTP